MDDEKTSTEEGIIQRIGSVMYPPFFWLQICCTI